MQFFFLYILQEKSRNRPCLRPHDTYCLFRMFFSEVNNNFFFVGDPIKYLGSQVAAEGGCEERDVVHRIN